MKPLYWQECPRSILEDFLWELELDYDPYEGSKAEVVHDALCGAGLSDTNEKIINACWRMLSEELFHDRCKKQIESYKHEIVHLKGLIDIGYKK